MKRRLHLPIVNTCDILDKAAYQFSLTQYLCLFNSFEFLIVSTFLLNSLFPLYSLKTLNTRTPNILKVATMCCQLYPFAILLSRKER